MKFKIEKLLPLWAIDLRYRYEQVEQERTPEERFQPALHDIQGINRRTERAGYCVAKSTKDAHARS